MCLAVGATIRSSTSRVRATGTTSDSWSVRARRCSARPALDRGAGARPRWIRAHASRRARLADRDPSELLQHDRRGVRFTIDRDWPSLHTVRIVYDAGIPIGFDLLIKNAHVLDPAQKLDSVLDIGISEQRIVALQPDLPADGV